jgi:hypothetical protein
MPAAWTSTGVAIGTTKAIAAASKKTRTGRWPPHVGMSQVQTGHEPETVAPRYGNIA